MRQHQGVRSRGNRVRAIPPESTGQREGIFPVMRKIILAPSSEKAPCQNACAAPIRIALPFASLPFVLLCGHNSIRQCRCQFLTRELRDVGALTWCVRSSKFANPAFESFSQILLNVGFTLVELLDGCPSTLGAQRMFHKQCVLVERFHKSPCYKNSQATCNYASRESQRNANAVQLSENNASK
jgi:hypothetical protein